MDKTMTKRRARIAGCGKYVPETVVKSEDLEKRLSLPAGWVEMHCGVKERRFAKEGELPSDFAVPAAKSVNPPTYDVCNVGAVVGIGRNPILVPAASRNQYSGSPLARCVASSSRLR